jgi:hypothetical protein
MRWKRERSHETAARIAEWGRPAGVHVLHVSTEKQERGVYPKPGANLFKGGREVDGEAVLGRERPGVDIGMREDEGQSSGAEVQ